MRIPGWTLPKLPPGMSALEHDLRQDRFERIVGIAFIAVLVLLIGGILLFGR